MHRLTLIAALVLAFLLASGCSGMKKAPTPVSATPVLQQIQKSGVLRVGLSGNQPPFNMTTRAGKIIGIEPDLANSLAESIGARAEFVVRPFGELLAALEAGEVDIVMSQMTMTPERNSRVAFAGPYFISGKAILTKSSTLAEADEAGDINRAGITLATLSGSTSEEFVRKAVPSARLIGTTDYDQAVKLVIDDGADAMVADFPICVISVLRYPDANLQTIATPFTFEPIGAAIPANDPLFVNLVQNYMNMLEGTGLMTALETGWFEDGTWLAELP